MIRYASDSSNPAFPFEEKSGDGTHYHSHSGMTMRNYFAAQALPSVIIQCANDARIDGETIEQMFARKSYLVADAMLKESTS
jgi:hypothetical protein